MSLWSEVADGIDYYVIAGSTMDDVIAGYREATGTAPMLPRWAFGYWQSKERYETQDQLMSAAREYRRRGLPLDNIVLDWHYWGKLGWNAMAFDSAQFPDPKGMIDSLHRLYNLHMMISIWPQVDSSTAVYRELKATGHLYPTEIWNGGKTYDAYSREAREIFWKHVNRGLYSLGVDAWWADATEPEWKWCDSLLDAKKGIVQNGTTAAGSASRYLNTYSLVATGGLYENQRKTNPSRRVVMLTRSAFAGQQRNPAAVWSGDISSNWRTFRNQIAAGANFCMAGIPYWNSDIGGFLPKEYGGEYPLGPRDPAYRELYVRWFQFGAFCPIFRAHGTDFPREIWQFGEPGSWAYDALVKFDRLRYRLLPYIYSVAGKVTREHYTMMRGLPMDFPDDPLARSSGDAYMFGPAFLVAPVTREMYFPKNPGIVIPPGNLRTPDGEPGLAGRYYSGKGFDRLVTTRTDSCVNFRWTEAGPPGLGKSEYTVRWEGKVLSREAGRYEFEVISDDGVNVWVDGRQIMDEMYPAGRQMNIGEMELQANRLYDIRLEYQQIDGGAEVALAWRTPSMLAGYRPNPDIQSMPVYLPGSARWTDFWSGEQEGGGKLVAVPSPIDIMPLFVRAGSIVPLGPAMNFASEKVQDPLEVRIYRGASGRFDLYEDANDGYGYERGEFSVIPFTWDEAGATLTIGTREGSYGGMIRDRTFEIVLVGKQHGCGADPAKPDRTVRYTGTKEVLRMEVP
jgi:alpha-D-xyloside xylohydrolase